MRINWLAYAFIHADGYGRYGINMVRSLLRLGVQVRPGLTKELEMPGFMQRAAGLDASNITIQCLPADDLRSMPGRVWCYSMTEDNSIPEDWPDTINQRAERVLVPCQHNADAFKNHGVKVPIHVVHGGTDPGEFPVLPWVKKEDGAYTFVCMADRGARKGFMQVQTAFFKTFPRDQYPNVRLVIKMRETTLPWLSSTRFPDQRLSIWREDTDTMSDVYAHGDCFVFPSLGEGWGMPPREAAMMGLPVIATKWSGLDVGLEQWGIPLEKFTLEDSLLEHENGQWAIPDGDELCDKMLWCYQNQEAAHQLGLRAATWLRANQTWDHSAQQLITLLEQYA